MTSLVAVAFIVVIVAVLAASSEGSAVHAEQSPVIWQLNFTFVYGIAASADGTSIYAAVQTNATTTKQLISFAAATGTQQWAAPLQCPPYSSSALLVGAQGIYAATTCGVHKFAFNGTQLWVNVQVSYGVGPEVDQYVVVGAVDAGNVAAVALDSTTGVPLLNWNISCSNGGGYVVLSSAGNIYVNQESLIAFPSDFSQPPLPSWWKSTATFPGAAGNGIVLALNSRLNAYAASDGQLLWHFDLLNGVDQLQHVQFLDNNEVLFGTASTWYAEVVILDCSSGVVQHQYNLPQHHDSYGSDLRATVSGNMIVIARTLSTRIVLYAFDRSTEVLLWEYFVESDYSVETLLSVVSDIVVLQTGSAIYAVQRPPSILLLIYPEGNCQGTAQQVSYSRGCASTQASSSIQRTCDGSGNLVMQWFNTTSACSGTPARVATYEVGQCVADAITATSFSVDRCV